MTTPPPRPPNDLLTAAWTEHERYLRGRLRGLGVAEAALDDAVQDVFEVLVRRLGDYDSRFSLRQWMAGVARKVARRHRERTQRAPEPVDEARVASPGPDPERWASRQEALASLHEFLAELDPDRWAVFVLSEIEGLRGTEIAAELGVNLNTVYARLRVARDSFERAVARRRRAERRAWLLLPWFGGSSARPLASAAFVTPLALLGVLTIGGSSALALKRCTDSHERSASDAQHHHRSATAEPGRLGVTAREADPARDGPRGAAPDEDGWIAAGGWSGSGPSGTWHERKRFRLRGDEVIVELEYTGDDATAVGDGVGWVELEGFERVEGPGSWPVALAAGERRVITLRLRATREGVVRADLHHGAQLGARSSSSGVWLVHERGLLRQCREYECERTADSVADSLFGESIRVELRNECSEDIEVALLPCEVMLPPPDAPRLRLAAGEVRTTTIDGGLCLGRVREDERLGSHVGVSDDFIVVFSGEDCKSVGAYSRDMPPEFFRSLGAPRSP